jgi:hypothetical protein
MKAYGHGPHERSQENRMKNARELGEIMLRQMGRDEHEQVETWAEI